MTTAKVSAERRRVQPAEITQDSVFQIRSDGINPEHVRDLFRVLQNGNDFDPITLWQSGDQLVLVDGLHRVEAYRHLPAKFQRKGIPAVIIGGDRTFALLTAARANSAAVMPWTPAERANFAWRLVRDSDVQLSKQAIAQATGTGTSTVARMRARWAVMQQKGAEPCGHWCIDREDRDAPPPVPLTSAELREQAEAYADGLKALEKQHKARFGQHASPVVAGLAVKIAKGPMALRAMFAGTVLEAEDEFADDLADGPAMVDPNSDF